MRPPSRTISAARRISRSCGFSGCSSKYWLTECDRRYQTQLSRGAGIIRAPLDRPRKTRAQRMQTLLEYVPWMVFGAVYFFGGGLYPATAALMLAMCLLLAYLWIRARKVPQVPLALTLVVLVFG